MKRLPKSETLTRTSSNGLGPGRNGRNGHGKKNERTTPLALPEMHRTLPHSVEAEQGALGSMIISPRDSIAECVESMTEEWFYVPAHQTIYKVMVELWKDNTAFDLIVLTQILRDKNILESVGGAAFVTSLYTFVPTAANLTYYREIMRDKFILRQIIAAATESVTRAFEQQDEVNQLLEDVEKKMLAIRPAEETRERAIKDDVMEAVEAIESLYERRGAITGVPTGFHDLDRITNGLQGQDMIVIAARPSMGKTALAMNIAEHVAINEKLPVLVFSLEMSRQQLVQRTLCSRARVNLQKVRDGFLSDRDFPSLTSAAAKIAGAPLSIIDEKLYIDSLVARARRAKAAKGIKLIVIDYLQLLRARGFKPDHRQQEVTYISAAIKGLAKDLSIPVIVLAQLNRQPENRHGGKPRLSDLRESGSIEQDADVVALLVRGEVYEEDEDARAEKAGEASLIIAKHRNGPIGEVGLTFLKEFTRFEDRARQAEPML